MRWVTLVCCWGWAVVCGCSADDNGALESRDAGLPPPFSGLSSLDAAASSSSLGAGAVECDLVSGSGCAPEQACRVDPSRPGAAACGPLAPNPRAPYALCNTDLQCPALHSCIGSVCKQLCREAADCGWQGAQCLPTRD